MGRDDRSSTAAILCQIAGPDERDRVSSRGWALGYLGGFILLALNLGLVTGHDALGLSDEALRAFRSLTLE